jgi:uncharacterized protein YbaR (Trm112 family)
MTDDCWKEYNKTEYHWTRRTEKEDDDEPRKPCEVCNQIKSDLSMREHHTSYKRDKTMLVCESCHRKIHRTDQYPELLPELSRQEAKDQGYLD